MNKAKHTPGPWFVGTMNDALFVVNEPPRPAPVDSINTALKTKVVAKPTEPHQEGWTVEEYEANARLIAAAPELLEAAKAVLRWIPENLATISGGPTSKERLLAAIGKAEGRAA